MAAHGSADFLDVLNASAVGGYQPEPAQIVSAPKSDRTTRPAADMTIEDQVVYAALVELIRTHLHPDLVEFTGEHQTYSEFERFPVAALANQAKYVVEADVASFYEYVDHS
jgi:hypothetical protein